MSIVKIIKNNKVLEDTWIGITLQPTETYEIPVTQWTELGVNQKVIDDITSGDVVVNDGTTDLTPSEGLEHIQLFQSDKAEDIKFNNTIAQLDGNPDNVQEAIEKVKGFRVQTLQFQLLQNLNFDEYFYAFKDAGGSRSGDRSNGYEFGGAAPIVALYSGTVVSASAAIKGIAVSTGSPAATVTVNLELWKVGFNGEGTKLGDITFDVNSSTYTVGTFWNTSIDTDFGENQAQSVNVTAGDLLALKFIRVQNSSNAVAIRNATVVLEIEGTA